MVFKIKKVINNNILCVTDDGDNEMIVTGRGIGFGHKTGQPVNSDVIQKVYHTTNESVQKKLIDLLEQVPYEHFLLTDELVSQIRKKIPYTLNEGLLITLADHISFAIKRKAKGAEFSNPLIEPIREYYPEEYQMGRYCLQQIKEKLSVDLSEDEAGFIALHIVNAELNTTMSVTNDITRFVDGCVKVVEAYYGRAYDHESLAFSRLTVHLRFFAQRLFQHQQESDESLQDAAFGKLIADNCKEHYACAQRISAYVAETWHQQLTSEELLFLTIHLKRINLSNGQTTE